MSVPTAEKTPVDVLDYDIDFTRWLPAGDEIASATATIEGTGTLAVDSIEWSLDSVKVWLSGGADGTSFTVSVVATTQLGRVKEVCFAMKVRDCH